MTEDMVLGKDSLAENQITKKIIGAAIEVHRTLGGPGLLESVYEEALTWELMHLGLLVERQVDARRGKNHRGK